LRSFRNKFEHDKLDRIIGADLLALMLTGAAPVLSERRLNSAADQLAEDLQRQGGARVTVERGTVFKDRDGIEVTLPILVRGERQRQLAVAVTHPLNANQPSDPQLARLAEFGDQLSVFCYHELRIRKALPAVTRDVLRNAGIGTR
jgi:hypothetical protein